LAACETGLKCQYFSIFATGHFGMNKRKLM
jgi:hypothetical protein